MDLDKFFNHLFGDHLDDENDQFKQNPFKNPKDFKSESGEDEHGKWETKKWKSDDGTQSYSSFSYCSKNMNDIMGEARNRADDVVNLRKQMKSLIDSEQYEKAAELRDKIKLLEESESKK